ncbi:MAG TPA: dihydroorotate dehydrogenase-like protein [Bacteroidetes bacterium]|nr:dihydroorotate dehydrogenase-like protein [Bacteroidota bacterium]
MDLSVNYLGLKIKSPIVVGSSSITNSVRNLIKIENSGAGAVVLKSIFEEEIYNEYRSILEKEKNLEFPDTRFLDYYDYKIKADNINKYLNLIKEAKKVLTIPVIASINCVSDHEWNFFARKLQDAGADAIELNLFILPSDFTKTCVEIENIYMRIIDKVKNAVTIPVSAKMSYYSADLAAFVKRVSESGVAGVVLFNRFFHPDFDIDKFEIIPSNVLSRSSDLAISLRWMSILSGRVSSDLIASTGVHDGASVIKEILAGADAVQVVSALYKNGIGSITDMIEEMKAWMEKHGFEKIDDFKGKMSQVNSPNPAEYERVQFMRYFEGKKYDLG